MDLGHGWLWINTYENTITIVGWTSSQIPAILMWTSIRGTIGIDTLPYVFPGKFSYASTLPGDLQFLRCRDPQTSGTSGHWKDSLGPTLKIRPEVRHQVLQLWYLHVSTIPLSTTSPEKIFPFWFDPILKIYWCPPGDGQKGWVRWQARSGARRKPLGDKGTTRSVSARTFFANRVGWWWIMIETKARLPSSI